MWIVSEVSLEAAETWRHMDCWSICYANGEWCVFKVSNSVRRKIASFNILETAKCYVNEYLKLKNRSKWVVSRIANGNLAIRRIRDGKSVAWSVLLDKHQIRVCKSLIEAKNYADQRLSPHRRSKKSDSINNLMTSQLG